MARAFLLLLSILLPVPVAAQPFTPAPGAELLHRPLDQIVDTNVRDGLVYYRALKSDRGRLDRYIASLNVTPAVYQGWSKNQQMAFWVNAYNAVVLQTVINHYPLKGTIRQIPGYEKTAFRAAGRTVTLEQIEKTILPEFKDPRLYLALGRGSIGGGRLRSEAYTGDRLDKQLAEIRTDFVNNRYMYRLDRGDEHDHRDLDPQLARGGVRRRLRQARRPGPEDPAAALARRARHHRVRLAQPAAVGTRVRPEERIQGRVPRDGLAPQRSHRRTGRVSSRQ